MRQEIREKIDHQEINAANAQHSTGPKTPEGKQGSAMNSFKHGLTGHNLMIQEDEQEAYDRLTLNLNAEHNPQTETERQLVQQIIHCFQKLNRAATYENNLFAIATLRNITEAPHDDATETTIAQTRAWIENENSFEKLDRYTSRIGKDLLKFQRELERLQDNRKAEKLLETYRARSSQRPQTRPVNSQMGSFCRKPENVAPVHNPPPAVRDDVPVHNCAVPHPVPTPEEVPQLTL